MIWDKVFWTWFIAMAFLVVFLLFTDFTPTNLVLSFFLIGLGSFKLSQENRGKKLSRKIIEKLKK
jgi:hypothetical protein